MIGRVAEGRGLRGDEVLRVGRVGRGLLRGGSVSSNKVLIYALVVKILLQNIHDIVYYLNTVVVKRIPFHYLLPNIITSTVT